MKIKRKKLTECMLSPLHTSLALSRTQSRCEAFRIHTACSDALCHTRLEARNRRRIRLALELTPPRSRLSRRRRLTFSVQSFKQIIFNSVNNEYIVYSRKFVYLLKVKIKLCEHWTQE